jgi:hypothetical protein
MAISALPFRHPGAAFATSAWRRAIAALLRSAGRWLDGLATALATPQTHDEVIALATSVEFAREACADEGAVYVDGVLAGYLPGVTRL